MEDEAHRLTSIESLNLSHKDRLKLKFGRAFAVAISESPELRKFVKEEALKMFNKDYDVLYHLVKNKPVQGAAFRGTAGSYATLRE